MFNSIIKRMLVFLSTLWQSGSSWKIDGLSVGLGILLGVVLALLLQRAVPMAARGGRALRARMQQRLAEARGRSLERFSWMAYVMISVDTDHERARQRASQFLGSTYAQDFTEFVDRVAIAGTVEMVVNRLIEFVRAGARHLVLLPCHDLTQRDATMLDPWLPELLAGVRGATART